MREYGQLRMRQGEETATFSVVDGNFKLEVKSNKVKSFDERADLAAERLIDYLKNYIAHSEKGVDDPMYQMAMTLLERNRQGDLDYKSISKLYELMPQCFVGFFQLNGLCFFFLFQFTQQIRLFFF